MEQRSVADIAQALNQARVRYLVVGGLAVVAHGLVRFTAGVDLVLDPDPEAMRRAIGALSGLGYRPRAPVAFVEFADPDKRRRWSAEKGLAVFSLFSPEHRATEIDLFVEAPFHFDEVYARAIGFEVVPGIEATFVGLTDLLEMKRKVARPLDLRDVEGLESLREPEKRDE